MGLVTLYEGNGGSQNIVATYSDTPQSANVKPNDEARSLKLNSVRPGCRIIVYDNPDAETTDDFCVIDVKQQSDEYIVASFERTYSDDTVQVTYVNNNGLDGKVSYIKIQ